MSEATIQTGNAGEATATRGWIVGHFIDKTQGLRHTSDVEIKWGIDPAGRTRDGWVTSEVRTTIAILVSGKGEMIFRDRAVLLDKPGDYVMWGPGVDHTWRAIDNTVLISIRWPSVEV